MPVPSLTDLFTPKTREEIVETILEVAGLVGLPVTAWQAQSVAREIITILAQEMSTYSEVGALSAGGGLLGYSAGDWLTLLAFCNFGVTRREATSGTCSLRLHNASTTAYTLDVGLIRALNPDSGSTYLNTSGAFLPVGGTVFIDLQAEEPGAFSNAEIGHINQLATPLQGVTVSNVTACIGNDGETDGELVTRCREAMARAAIAGPSDAYSYYAKTTFRPDGSSAGVTKVKIVQGNGTVTVYLANSGGAVSSADVALVNQNIQANVVPTGYTATVLSATPQDVLISANIYLKQGSSYSTVNAQQAAYTALVNYFSEFPIGGSDIGTGGKLFLDVVIGILYSAIPGEILQVEVTSPASDVSVNQQNVLQLTSTTSSFTILRPS